MTLKTSVADIIAPIAGLESVFGLAVAHIFQRRQNAAKLYGRAQIKVDPFAH